MAMELLIEKFEFGAGRQALIVTACLSDLASRWQNPPKQQDAY